MTVNGLCGFEAQEATADGVTLTGTAAYSTAQARTGVASLRCNPASGASGSFTPTGAGPIIHFGIYIATLPTTGRVIAGNALASNSNLFLNTDGTIAYRVNTAVTGTSTVALATGRWYWIGYVSASAGSQTLLQIDAVDQVTGSPAGSGGNTIGFTGGEASAADIYFDDFVADGSTFITNARVALLVPTADSAKGTGWTNDAASSTSLFPSVDNKPPAGVADTTAGTGLHQIRNATSNANSNYDATMTTYTAAGLTANDTTLAVLPIIATAAPVTTSSKQGTVGVVSNPAITNVALGSGGTAGAFWSGVAGGTYPTGWKVSRGTLTTSPTVTIATAPVMRVTQVTSSTRIAMVCFMGIAVAWTPGALNPIQEVGTFATRGPRNINQGVNRASSY